MSSTTNTTDGFTELLGIRNALYLGNYGMAISKATVINLSASTNNDEAALKKLDRDTLLYRAQIGMGQYDLVIHSISESDPSVSVGLKAVRLLAQFFQQQHQQQFYKNQQQQQQSPSTPSANSSIESILEQLEHWIQDPTHMYDTTVPIMACIVYHHLGRLYDALRVVYNPLSLEMYGLKIHTLLRLGRIDMAQQALEKMQKANDDATLTQLSHAIVSLARGGQQHISDAGSVLQNLMDKYGGSILCGSVVLCDAMAVYYMLNKQFDEATKLLTQALSMRGNGDTETVVNMVVCALLSESSNANRGLVQRYIAQLQSGGAHPWVEDYAQKEQLFDQLAQKYSRAQ